MFTPGERFIYSYTKEFARSCLGQNHILVGCCITMYCVLVVYRDRLFAQNQLQMAPMEVLALVNKRLVSESDKKMDHFPF